VVGVRRRVRRRQVRHRALAGSLAAAVIVVTGLAWQGSGDDGGVVIAPGETSTTESTTTSSTTTSSNTSTTWPLGDRFSIHNLNLADWTYAPPCPGDDRPATLVDGSAELPIGDGARYVVELGPFDYAEVGGQEVAVVALTCEFIGANVDVSASLQAYAVGPADGYVQVGTGQMLEHVHDISADSSSVTADLDVYAADDAQCCPSSGARETWRFDGDGFTLVDSTPIPPPGAG
jgi:hypothetical protein